MTFKAFKLEQLFNTDASYISCEVVGDADSRISIKSTKYMEKQANQLAPRIQMPKEPFTIKAKEYIAYFMRQTDARHTVDVMEMVIGALERYYGVSRQAVKVRLVELGFEEAIGTFNYVDGHYVKPHGFRKGATMLNKLVYGHQSVLKPLLRTLRGMDDKDRLLRIQELEICIEGNTDRKQILTSLMATGVLEPTVFNKENTALVIEEQKLRAEKEKLMNYVGGDITRMKELQKLMSFTSKGRMLTEFEDDIFLAFVESITVESRAKIVFHLKCGLNLAERLVI